MALLVNMIAPARVALYSALSKAFDLIVLHGGIESNRTSWRNPDGALPAAVVKRSWGWQIRVARKSQGKTIDQQYIHITPGLIVDLLRARPDVLVTNEMGLRTITALCYGGLFRKPVWVWWGGTLHTERNIGRLRRSLRGILARRVRHWISYGRSSTAYLVSLMIDPSHILEIQNSVDERWFLRDLSPALSVNRRPLLLCVGRLVALKGIDLLLEAAARLQRDGIVFSLLIVGDGPDTTILRCRAEDLRLDNVQFHSAYPPEQMPAIYSSADCLIFPTLEDVWGLVVNEAILSGLPVLCSKYAGCATELLSDECVFDPADADDFASGLRRAVRGELPRTPASRIVSTPQNAEKLISTIYGMSVHPRLNPTHAES